MLGSQWASEFSTGLAEIANVPHQRLRSSSGSDWGNLIVASYAVLPQPELCAIPAILRPFHTIYLHLSPRLLDIQYDFAGCVGHAKCSPGALTLGPAHHPTAFGWNDCALHVNVSLTPQLVAATAEAICKGDPLKLELMPHFNVCDPLAEQVCRALLTELDTGRLAGKLYADTLGQTLAVHLIRTYGAGAATQSAAPHTLSAAQLRRVLDYINDQLERSFTLAELATVAGLGPTYFAHQFKCATGLAPHQYLIRCRVARARALLQLGNLSVGTVAQLVGFADQSHLHRHFKRLEGVAPGALLKDRKNIHDLEKHRQDVPLPPGIV